MRKLIPAIFLLPHMVIGANALEIEPPPVPDAGLDQMPRNTSSFSEALADILRSSFTALHPELSEALRTAVTVICVVMVLSVVHRFSTDTKRITNIAGVSLITSILLKNTNTLILLGIDTINSLSEYGKLLLPVYTYYFRYR